MNLLIADDEAVIRRGLLSLDWKSIGITDVYSVANGAEAKELLLSTPIDLVILISECLVLQDWNWHR